MSSCPTLVPVADQLHHHAITTVGDLHMGQEWMPLDDLGITRTEIDKAITVDEQSHRSTSNPRGSRDPSRLKWISKRCDPPHLFYEEGSEGIGTERSDRLFLARAEEPEALLG